MLKLETPNVEKTKIKMLKTLLHRPSRGGVQSRPGGSSAAHDGGGEAGGEAHTHTAAGREEEG